MTFLLDFPENLLTSRWPLNTTENYSRRRVSRILDMDFYEKAPCTRFGEVVYPAPKTTASYHCPQTLRRSLSGKKVLGLVVISSFGVVGYSRMPH